MKSRIFIVHLFMLCGLAGGLMAQMQLGTVPAAMPASSRAVYEGRRAQIERDWQEYERQRAAFQAQYGGREGTPEEVAAADKHKAELTEQGNAVLEAADIFNDHLDAWGQALTIDHELAQIPRQLAGFGFTHANHDFAWYEGQSGQARDQMIAQLVASAGTYVTDKSEAVLKDRFLERIQKMSKHDANKLAQKFVDLHIRNPVFQDWLRSFSPKASRAVLVTGAKEAIDTLKRQEDFFKMVESLDKGSVAGRQEAFLTVVSLFDDYPGLKELKALSAGLYDVGAAWATIIILDRGIDDLTASTETQLVNQKKLIIHQQELVKKRRELAPLLVGYP